MNCEFAWQDLAFPDPESSDGSWIARVDAADAALPDSAFVWEDCAPADAGAPAPPLRVATFNVLADSYTRTHRQTAGAAALAWEGRFARLLAAIRRANADLLALQEIDAARVELEWRPALRALGYDCVFAARPQGAAADGFGAAHRVCDGCLTAWRRGGALVCRAARALLLDSVVEPAASGRLDDD